MISNVQASQTRAQMRSLTARIKAVNDTTAWPAELAVLWHFLGALEVMTEDGQPVASERILAALDRAVENAEAMPSNVLHVPSSGPTLARLAEVEQAQRDRQLTNDDRGDGRVISPHATRPNIHD